MISGSELLAKVMSRMQNLSLAGKGFSTSHPDVQTEVIGWGASEFPASSFHLVAHVIYSV